MLYKTLKFKYLIFIILLCFLAALTLFSSVGTKGAQTGLKVCATVIIPSFFPYTFAVIFLSNLGVSNIFKPFKRIIKILFNMNTDVFFAFLLSFLGGYPSGAKLINEMHKKGQINADTANNLLLFCVNAGPAFIVIAIGNNILFSNECGIILLASHILSSLFFALLLRRKNTFTICKPSFNEKSISENFVLSVTDAANTVLKICFFVILFSVFNAFIDEFAKTFEYLKVISLFCEVTTAVYSYKNIYFISFILGFAGISIWCQIFAIVKDLKINTLKFILSRLLHGILNCSITYLLIKTFRPEIVVISNNINGIFNSHINTPQVIVCLVIMLILLIISIENKNTCGKIRNDLL